ncbi:RHS repeat-associated core domain-containing protein [Dictyobacter vulcani]|nr:RHS repeat-associated core domain-containing protein [Dictyobacter vulcani]
MLGSTSIALKADGSVQAVQLFAPFGGTRYSDGSMTTPYNYTGQRLDTTSGLLYYNARYYDATSGRFTSADTVETNGTGLDPYAYVKGSPETFTDPTGHGRCGPDGDCVGVPGAGTPGQGSSSGGGGDSGSSGGNPGGGGGNPGGGGGNPGSGGGNPGSGGGNDGVNHSCAGLTAAACKHGEDQRTEQNTSDKDMINLVKVGATIINVVVDWMQMRKDMDQAWSFDKIVELIGNVISLAGDALSAISQIASLFKWTSVQLFADRLGSFVNSAAALYKMARASWDSAFGFWARAGITAGFFALKAGLYAEDPSSLVVPVAQAAASAAHFDGVFAGKAIGSAFQAIWQHYQANIDQRNLESVSDFCKSSSC